MQEQLRSSCAQWTFTGICVVFATCLLLPAGVIRARGVSRRHYSGVRSTAHRCYLLASTMIFLQSFFLPLNAHFNVFTCVSRQARVCALCPLPTCLSSPGVLIFLQFDMPNVWVLLNPKLLVVERTAWGACGPHFVHTGGVDSGRSGRPSFVHS